MLKSILRFWELIPDWIKRTLPILVSMVILYYYFHNQDWRQLLQAASRANFLLAIPSIIVPQLFFWYCEVLITKKHMVWFHKPFSFRAFFWIRGAIYLLMMINMSLGSGGILLYLWKKVRISWAKLWGIMVFRFGLTLWGLCVLLVPITVAMHHYGYTEHFSNPMLCVK